jgi:hypothetical protein
MQYLTFSTNKIFSQTQLEICTSIHEHKSSLRLQQRRKMKKFPALRVFCAIKSAVNLEKAIKETHLPGTNIKTFGITCQSKSEMRYSLLPIGYS